MHVHAAAGDVERDFWLAFDMLRSAKDHAEFTVVRESVRDALGRVADNVRVDREKSVLKQAAVQHLYGRLSATLRPGCGDADLLVRLYVLPLSVASHDHKRLPHPCRIVTALGVNNARLRGFCTNREDMWDCKPRVAQ